YADRRGARSFPTRRSSDLGYQISRLGGQGLGSPAGVFLSALVVTVAGNGYARWMNRPGALIRVPGIIMLVPGSTSLRSLLVAVRSEEHTSELQSRENLVCR